MNRKTQDKSISSEQNRQLSSALKWGNRQDSGRHRSTHVQLTYWSFSDPSVYCGGETDETDWKKVEDRQGSTHVVLTCWSFSATSVRCDRATDEADWKTTKDLRTSHRLTGLSLSTQCTAMGQPARQTKFEDTDLNMLHWLTGLSLPSQCTVMV